VKTIWGVSVQRSQENMAAEPTKDDDRRVKRSDSFSRSIQTPEDYEKKVIFF